jgi:hypothetical protein
MVVGRGWGMKYLYNRSPVGSAVLELRLLLVRGDGVR